jgi:hypothetical protein
MTIAIAVALLTALAVVVIAFADNRPGQKWTRK